MQLKDKVFQIVKRIPKGKVLTYRQIAIKLHTSPRAVARILSRNTCPIKIPCHRVIKSNGEIGGYTFKGKFKPEMKIRLLKQEGIKIKEKKITNL